MIGLDPNVAKSFLFNNLKNIFKLSIIYSIFYFFLYFSIDIKNSENILNFILILILLSVILAFFCYNFILNPSYLNNYLFITFNLYLFFSLLSSLKSGIGFEWLLITALCFNVLSFPHNEKYQNIIIILINFFFLVILFFATFSIIGKIFFERPSYGLVAYVLEKKSILIPRASGISRIISIIFLNILIFYLIYKTKINFLLKIIILIKLLTLFFIILVYFQSRGSLLALTTSIFISFYLIYLRSINFFIIIALMLLFFILLFYFLYYFQIGRFDDFHSLIQSSGRLQLWLNALQTTGFSLIGSGMQTDRYLYNSNISNLFIYSYINAGLLGFLCIVSHIFLTLKKFLKIFKYFFNHNLLNKFIIAISFSYFVFLIIRSVFENSFSIFGLDLILWTLVIKTALTFDIKNEYFKTIN